MDFEMSYKPTATSTISSMLCRSACLQTLLSEEETQLDPRNKVDMTPFLEAAENGYAMFVRVKIYDTVE